MFVSQKKVQIGLSISANIPGLIVPDLQSILTQYKVPKWVKRSLGAFKVGDFIYKVKVWTDIVGISCILPDLV